MGLGGFKLATLKPATPCEYFVWTLLCGTLRRLGEFTPIYVHRRVRYFGDYNPNFVTLPRSGEGAEEKSNRNHLLFSCDGGGLPDRRR